MNESFSGKCYQKNIALTAIGILFSSHVFATTASLPAAQENLMGIQQEMDKVKPEYERLQDENKLLSRELNNLSERLVIITEKVQISEEHINYLEKNLKALDSKERDLSSYLQTKKAETAKVLSAIGRLSLAPQTPLGETEGEIETVKAALVLKSLTEDLKKKADLLGKQLRELSETRTSLQQTRTELANEKLTLNTDQQKLEILLLERKKRIEQNNAGLVKQKQYIANLSVKERNISSLIDKIQQQEKQALEQKKQELARMADQMKTSSEMVVSQERPPQAAGVQVASLENRPMMLADKGAGGVLSAQDFMAQKGMLLLPLSGELTARFGQKDMTGKAKQGITIRSRAGSLVAAPVQGEVIFVGKFRDYGHMVIIKPTEDYHILVAGLGTTHVTLGQKIVKGEPIGKMPQTALQSSLYLEMRYHRHPIDPSPWLKMATR